MSADDAAKLREPLVKLYPPFMDGMRHDFKDKPNLNFNESFSEFNDGPHTVYRHGHFYADGAFTALSTSDAALIVGCTVDEDRLVLAIYHDPDDGHLALTATKAGVEAVKGNSDIPECIDTHSAVDLMKQNPRVEVDREQLTRLMLIAKRCVLKVLCSDLDKQQTQPTSSTIAMPVTVALPVAVNVTGVSANASTNETCDEKEKNQVPAHVAQAIENAVGRSSSLKGTRNNPIEYGDNASTRSSQRVRKQLEEAADRQRELAQSVVSAEKIGAVKATSGNKSAPKRLPAKRGREVNPKTVKPVQSRGLSTAQKQVTIHLSDSDDDDDVSIVWNNCRETKKTPRPAPRVTKTVPFKSSALPANPVPAPQPATQQIMPQFDTSSLAAIMQACQASFSESLQSSLMPTLNKIVDMQRASAQEARVTVTQQPRPQSLPESHVHAQPSHVHAQPIAGHAQPKNKSKIFQMMTHEDSESDLDVEVEIEREKSRQKERRYKAQLAVAAADACDDHQRIFELLYEKKSRKIKEQNKLLKLRLNNSYN
jgi:hypothetical protein